MHGAPVMGWFSRALGLDKAGDLLAAAAVPPVGSTTDPVVWREVFGVPTPVSDHVTRKQAMSIPAVRRGRQIICGTISAAPLVCVRSIAGRSPERVQRTLLVQPSVDVTRAYTLSRTLDALLFFPVAWWRVTERGSDGKPLHAEFVGNDRVAIDRARGEIRIDGKRVADEDLIRFDGPDEGLLDNGGRTLKTALLLEEAVRKYARMDVPLGVLADEDGGLQSEEVRELLDAWEAAREARTTAYLPKGLRYDNPAWSPEQLELAGARAYQTAEIARLLNMPASYINAPSNDPLTYSTTESNRRELVDITLAPYISALEQRLSMPDVTPQGTNVFVDLSGFIRGDLTAVLSAAKTAIDAGVMTVDEIRTEWLRLGPMPTSGGPGNA